MTTAVLETNLAQAAATAADIDVDVLESLPHWTWTPKVGFRQAAS